MKPEKITFADIMQSRIDEWKKNADRLHEQAGRVIENFNASENLIRAMLEIRGILLTQPIQDILKERAENYKATPEWSSLAYREQECRKEGFEFALSLIGSLDISLEVTGQYDEDNQFHIETTPVIYHSESFKLIRSLKNELKNPQLTEIEKNKIISSLIKTIGDELISSKTVSCLKFELTIGADLSKLNQQSDIAEISIKEETIVISFMKKEQTFKNPEEATEHLNQIAINYYQVE
jgi:hypothetical protein